jgi:hypothetical protein
MQLYISQEQFVPAPEAERTVSSARSPGLVRLAQFRCARWRPVLWCFCYLVVFGSITSRKRRDRMAANER